MYRDGKFPFEAMCTVSFMWKPMSSDYSVKDGTKREVTKNELDVSSENFCRTPRQIWLWIHAASFDEVAHELRKVCSSVAEGSQQ